MVQKRMVTFTLGELRLCRKCRIEMSRVLSEQ